MEHGKWNSKTIVSEKWVSQSTKPHVQVDETTEYGYFWWLKDFGPENHRSRAYCMLGNGGNKVCLFPTLDLAVVITSTNYNTKGMHEQTDRILSDHILGSIERIAS